ncbi:DUF4190 domain-containing protein [Actinoplanes sp. NPDC024001]|uniref:DUF4190 domain-containing protein n=1 Tax=Actinoplanes sp. NPDC024001 TaxID=3154598 RepID=UPI0033D7C1A5
MTQYPGTAYPPPPHQPGGHPGQVPPPPPHFGPPSPYAAPQHFVPPPTTSWELERVDAVGGTEFGLAQLRVPPITSGLAIGSLVAGIGTILVSFLAGCFGTIGAGEDWGAVVTGAFTLLCVLAGGGAITAGVIALRQIRRSGQTGRVRFTGRGLGIAGIVCGGIGAGIGVLALLLGLLLQPS